MKIFVTDYDGKIHELEALEGWRIMEIIRDWGLDMRAECGGACACATCEIYIDEDWLDKVPPASAEEEDMLDNVANVKDNSRLSCQILMSKELDGLRLTLSPNSKS